MENKSMGSALVEVFDAAVSLAKSEISGILKRTGEVVKAKGIGVVLLLGAVGPLLLALIFLILFVFYALMRLGLGAWAAALLISLFSFGLTGALVLLGVRRLTAEVKEQPRKLTQNELDDLKYGNQQSGAASGDSASNAVAGGESGSGSSGSGGPGNGDAGKPDISQPDAAKSDGGRRATPPRSSSGEPVGGRDHGQHSEASREGPQGATMSSSSREAGAVPSTGINEQGGRTGGAQPNTAGEVANPQSAGTRMAQAYGGRGGEVQAAAAQKVYYDGDDIGAGEKKSDEDQAEHRNVGVGEERPATVHGREVPGIPVSTEPTYREDMKKEGY
jgi:Putative Actinobacterial Holin-X, holin superfamily III